MLSAVLSVTMLCYLLLQISEVRVETLIAEARKHSVNIAVLSKCWCSGTSERSAHLSDGREAVKQCRRQTRGFQVLSKRIQVSRSRVAVVVAVGARSEGDPPLARRASLPPSHPSQLSSHLVLKVTRLLGRRRRRRLGKHKQPHLVMFHPLATDTVIWYLYDIVADWLHHIEATLSCSINPSLMMTQSL